MAALLSVSARFTGVLSTQQPVQRSDALSLHGSTPHLTPLESGLLYLLIANAGRVVSREDIIDCVWGAEAEPTSNLVDRHIRDLRRKLQDDWRWPNVIATMRGEGYMVPITD